MSWCCLEGGCLKMIHEDIFMFLDYDQIKETGDDLLPTSHPVRAQEEITSMAQETGRTEHWIFQTELKETEFVYVHSVHNIFVLVIEVEKNNFTPQNTVASIKVYC